MASILDEIKKVCNVVPDYTAYDVDIIMHINATFSVLAQLGVGPDDGFFITDNTTEWEAFDVPDIQRNLVKSYMFLKVQFLFDPPTTSYLITAKKEQIAEFEWRLNDLREADLEEEVTP